MITIFTTGDKIQHKLLMAFAKGLAANGESYRIADIRDKPTNCDVGVVFGYSSVAHPWIIEHVEREGGRALFLDYGVLGDGFSHWTVGWDDIMGNADFMNECSPADRWYDFGIEIEPWRSNGDHVLLIGQVPWDGSVRNINIVEWCVSTAYAIQKLTDRPVVFRPHPLAVHETPKIPGTQFSVRSYADDLDFAWAVVTWNSTSAGLAVLKGIPVIAMDQGSIAWPVAESDLNRIAEPRMPDREQWAFNLAYSQWTLEEIASGLVWERLKPGRAL
jgi:hypothetical protein